MQPGYDALGFISCTGTNFVVRAAALKEVGGSPTYTLTEDFALGMALKMYGWHCRYVQVAKHAAVACLPLPKLCMLQVVRKTPWSRATTASVLQEYLAIGEAPDQIRNCYQQRSRWCKVRSICHIVVAQCCN
jgi:endoglucanase